MDNNPKIPMRYLIEVFIEPNGAANYEVVSQPGGPFMFSHDALAFAGEVREHTLNEVEALLMFRAQHEAIEIIKPLKGEKNG